MEPTSRGPPQRMPEFAGLDWTAVELLLLTLKLRLLPAC